ncbi:MAG: DUF6525 family protein [Gemmobacter sp.]
MPRNLTSPRARWRATDPMAAHDRLPAPLRAWAAAAALPWSAASVLRIWRRALTRGGDHQAALEALNRAEAATLARERALVWGADAPPP